MQYTLATLALAAVAAAVPQGVTSAISPKSSAPAGCMASYSGSFGIETVNVTTSSSKRGLQARQAQALSLTLSNGILKDDKGRTGYIAGGNSQFQFDSPPQTGAEYTAGWSVCANGSLALGGTTIFQQCLQAPVNGQGGYYDLYFQSNAQQCSPIYIVAIPNASQSGAVSQLSDGQPTATPVPICQLSDGQPQVTSCVQKVSQLSDGQIQATSAAAAVSQLSDGQIRVTSAQTGAPVTQLTDGQIRGGSAKPTGTPVVQISDGQIRGGASATSSTTSRAPSAYTGAAMPTAAVRGEVFGLAAAGALAVALL